MYAQQKYLCRNLYARRGGLIAGFYSIKKNSNKMNIFLLLMVLLVY